MSDFARWIADYHTCRQCPSMIPDIDLHEMFWDCINPEIAAIENDERWEAKFLCFN
jgi:hypothetical protein